MPRSLRKFSAKVNKLQRFVSLNSVTPYCKMSQGNCAENAVCIVCEREALHRLCNYSRNLCLIQGTDPNPFGSTFISGSIFGILFSLLKRNKTHLCKTLTPRFKFFFSYIKNAGEAVVQLKSLQKIQN